MAEKLPSGRYRTRITYKENGERKSKSFTADTAAEADYAALEYKLGKRRRRPSTMTVEEAVNQYIEDNDAILSPATLHGYKKELRCHMEMIKAAKFSELTDADVQRWINALCKKDLSPKTVMNAYGLLCSVTRAYSPGMDYVVNLPQRTKIDFVIPTDDNVKAILAAAADTTLPLPIMLAAYCGLRRSEIAALRWGDIDLKAKTIHVRRAVVRGEHGWENKGTKSYDGDRVVTCPQSVVDALTLLDRTKPVISIHADIITKQFGRLCKSLNLPYHFHLLRHYYASVLLKLNVPYEYAVRLMGHKDDKKIRTVYGHLFNDKETEIATTLNNYFDGQ